MILSDHSWFWRKTRCRPTASKKGSKGDARDVCEHLCRGPQTAALPLIESLCLVTREDFPAGNQEDFRKWGSLQDQQESTLPAGDEGLSVITGGSWKLLHCHAERPFLCKVTFSPAAYIRGHQKWRCEKAVSSPPAPKGEGEKDKGKRGLCVLKNQSFTSVLGTKLTVIKKEQSHLQQWGLAPQY